MSQPENPDRRQLPPGWIQQYDRNYNAWFYVNTRENPPKPSWTHPQDIQAAFIPPPGPPPPSRSPYQAPPGPQYGGYGAPQQAGYPGYGAPPDGGYAPSQPQNRGWFNGGSSQPPPQVVYEEAPPPKKHGMGMGSMLAVGGAGLLGGALIEDLVENHDDREQQIGYDQGYDQGFDNGDQFGQDDGFGGGGW